MPAKLSFFLDEKKSLFSFEAISTICGLGRVPTVVLSVDVGILAGVVVRLGDGGLRGWLVEVTSLLVAGTLWDAGTVTSA